MAHPGFIIEQYVFHFLSQWRVGLQPSLTLHAKPNGKIDVRLNLTSFLSSNQDEDHFIVVVVDPGIEGVFDGLQVDHQKKRMKLVFRLLSSLIKINAHQMD